MNTNAMIKTTDTQVDEVDFLLVMVDWLNLEGSIASTTKYYKLCDLLMLRLVLVSVPSSEF